MQHPKSVISVSAIIETDLFDYGVFANKISVLSERATEFADLESYQSGLQSGCHAGYNGLR